MRRLVGALATGVATVAFAVGIVPNTVVPAEAAVASGCSFKLGKTYPGGPGHPSKVRAGIWECGGHEGFCFDFAEASSNSTSLREVTKLPGLSPTKSRQVKLLTSLYSHTKDPTVASDAALASWWIEGDHDIKLWYPWAVKHGYISAAQVARINALISDSKKSPTRHLTVVSEPVFPTKVSKGSVTVVDGNHKPVAGVTPKVTVKNARFILKPGKTNAKGVAAFTLTPINVGKVHVSVLLRGPGSTKVYLTRSSAHHQRILISGPRTIYRASTEFEKRPNSQFVTVCNSDCKGVAKVTFKASVAKDGLPARFTLFKEGQVWKTFDVAPGKTVTRFARMPDGTHLTGNFAYLDKVRGRVITKTVSLKPYEVICPPWLKVTSKVDCDCKGTARITLSLSAPSGARYYKAVVQLNGRVIATKKLGHKVHATVGVSVKHGDRLSVSFTAYRMPYKGSLLHDKPYDITWN